MLYYTRAAKLKLKIKRGKNIEKYFKWKNSETLYNKISAYAEINFKIVCGSEKTRSVSNSKVDRLFKVIFCKSYIRLDCLRSYAQQSSPTRARKVRLNFYDYAIALWNHLPLCAMSSAVTEAMRPVAPGHGATAAPSCCEGRIFGPLNTSVHCNTRRIDLFRKQ